MATFRRSVLVSILFTVFGGPGVILVLLPYLLTGLYVPSSEPIWWRAAAGALILVGLVPLLESIVRFVRVGRGTLMPTVPTERLVVSGLYRYVRNPMYVGDVMVLLGEAVLLRSYLMVLYMAFIWEVLNAFVCKYEEPTLLRRHGSEYAEYCERVGRWWPRSRPHSGA